MATSRKRRYSVLVIQESLLLRGRCYPTHPITIGPFRSRSDPKGVEKGRRALCRRTLLATAGAGLVPLRLSALSRLTYCYLRTTTEAMACLYRVILPREDRIPQSGWSDYTLVYSSPATRRPCEQCRQLSLSVLGLIRGVFWINWMLL
jgi:hypothetical protein